MKRMGLLTALILLGITWGLTIPLTKVAVSTGYKPMGLIFWQLVISFVVLGAFCLVRRLRPAIDRRHLVFFGMVGLLGTLLPNSFSYLAITHLPAGVMSIIIASVPMFSMAIALGLRLERFSLHRSLGVLLGAGAIVVLVGPESSLPDPGKAVFILVAVIAPFCYGLEGNYLATRTPAGAHPVTVLWGASAVGALIAVPLVIATGSWIDPMVPWGAPEWSLFLASVFHALAYTGYVWLVGVAGAVFASQIAYVVTMSGFLMSTYFLDESHSVWVLAALALMMVGLVLVQPRRRESHGSESDARILVRDRTSG